MVVGDVVSLGGLVLQVAGQIQKLGENWYKASKDWEAFPGKVENFRRSYEVWRDELERYDMLSDPILMAPLDQAKRLLEKEEEKLKNRDPTATSCVAGCWPKLCTTAFPGTIGQKLQSVIDAFDNIPNTLELRRKARAAVEKGRLQKPRSLVFRNDDRYVPLEDTESAVYSALEVQDNRDGPTVVLLHGGPGKGKSTLARRAAVHYENLRTKGKKGADKGAPFQQVIYLEYGQNATPLSMQVELLQWLGMEATAFQVDQQSDRDSKISDLLISALKSRKVLIIFDDVGDKEFLRQMLHLCGDGVKCLVTSQNGSLCWGLQCQSTPIRIEDVKPEVGRKILASYVFPKGNQQLPDRVLGVANEIVEKCQGNPLALASVSIALRKYPGELTEWENAKTSMLALLESEDTPEILSRKYPRSFVSAIQLPVKALEEEGLQLLILVHLCAAPSVPEEVVRVLHQRIQGRSRAFQVLRDELEDQELIKVTSPSLDRENPGKERSWSVHSLQKQFMKEDGKMRKMQENVLASILEGASSALKIETRVESEIGAEFFTDEDVMVTTAMCSLYFDREFALQAASKMGVDRERFEENFNNLRRNAIEPVTRLLGQPASQRWTPDSQALTKQVFLEYICNVRLHNEGIVHLLSSEISTLPMLNALDRVATIQEKQLVTAETQGIVAALVGLLRNWDPTDSFESTVAAMAIRSLSFDPAHKEFIISSGLLEETVKILSFNSPSDLQVALTRMLGIVAFSKDVGLSFCDDLIFRILQTAGLLEQQISFLSRDSDPLLQTGATGVLVNLAASSSEEMKLRILDSGGLQQLVNSLSKDSNPELQTNAAWALGNLAILEKPALKIFDFEGALEQLASALSKDTNPDLQKQAAAAFANLAGSPSSSEEMKLRILDSGGLQQLVNSLSKDGNPGLQTNAAWALSNLAILEKPAVKIFRFEGALEQLASALSKDTNPDLQEQAALAFVNLARLSSEEVKLGILESRALQQLVNSLSKDDNPRLQANAAWALRNLASLGEPALKIFRFQGAMEQLASALSKDANPDLQEQAALAFVNLAGSPSSSEEVKLGILDSGALQQLVNSLSKDCNPGLQSNAAWALRNLAILEEPALKIFHFQGAMEQLANALSKDTNPNLQEQAARAFVTLGASPSEEVKLGILGSGALQQLVNSLSKDGNPGLQTSAVGALANLAILEEPALKIFHFQGAMEQLASALSKDTNADLQERAAMAFANLARSSSEEVKLGILDSGALQFLVNSLSKDWNPGLQRSAARALGNLASLEESALKIIHFQGAMEQLASAFSKDTNPDLQEQAARAFVTLAGSSSEEVKLGILDSGALQQLVNSLSKDGNPGLQTSAVGALANLASLEKPALKIFHFQGAMEQLASALSKDTNPDLQARAATAFANLARSSSEEVKLGILDSGAVQQLSLLCKDGNPRLQTTAARALDILARSSSEEVKLRILSSVAPQQLRDVLSKDGHPELQFWAGSVLVSLGELSLEEVILRIFNSGASIPKLVTSVCKDSPELRTAVHQALGNLARGNRG